MSNWLGFDPTPYDRDGWQKHVFAIRPGQMKWHPRGIVLHATGLPTLSQWVESGPAHDQRLINLEQFYQRLGWKHGPHAFVSRNFINGFSALTDRGTHCSCWNSDHFGFEQAGNYNRGHDDYNSGDGAKVKANAIWCMAVICYHFGINPEKDIIPHAACKHDGHFSCPGNLVDMAEMRTKVADAMKVLL